MKGKAKFRQALPFFLIGAWHLSHAAPARAEANDRAAYADYLFQEGVRLMKDNDCPNAIPKFLSSDQLDPSAASLMNVATCYGQLGRTASAWRAYHKAATMAIAEHDAELKAQAFKAISMLEPTLTRLRLVTLSDNRLISLTLNGEPLSTEEGMPIPLDPGENVIEAFAPGRQPWRRSVNAHEPGAIILINVPELPPTEKPDDNARWRTSGIVLTGAGAASLVVGLILGVSAKVTYDQSSSDCDPNVCNERGHELRDHALDKANVATYAVGLGALMAGAGVALWLASPSPTPRAVTVRPVVRPEEAGFGLTVEGSL